MLEKEICVTVNGRQYKKTVPCNKTLLRFLREDLYLQSVKEGCNEGECGACTVIMDGYPVNSCLVLAAELDGKTSHSWFVGFSNVEDPDIVVAVIAEDSGAGSTTAVPIAREIFNSYYSS